MLRMPTVPNFVDEGKYNAADITWIMVATALVFLMTPGLAFFYGGMVHRKNVISTMIKSVVAAGVVSVLWVFMGFSLVFGESIGRTNRQSRHLFCFSGCQLRRAVGAGAHYSKNTFCLLPDDVCDHYTGLVVGAVAERIRFTSYILFIALFTLLVYAPLAHWTWHPDGFLFKMGVLDFAGGTVVHISAGCAALVGALVLKQRLSHRDQTEIPPANIPTYSLALVCCGLAGLVSTRDRHWPPMVWLFPLLLPPMPLLLRLAFPGCFLMY